MEQCNLARVSQSLKVAQFLETLVWKRFSGNVKGSPVKSCSGGEIHGLVVDDAQHWSGSRRGSDQVPRGKRT